MLLSKRFNLSPLIFVGDAEVFAFPDGFSNTSCDIFVGHFNAFTICKDG